MNFDTWELIDDRPQINGGMGSAEYAGFLRRLVAEIIDNIIMSVLIGTVALVPVLLAAFAMPMSKNSGSGTILCLWSLVVIIALMIIWLYNARLESSRLMATPGKLLMGIVVTDIDGGRISFGKATLRCICKFLSIQLLIIFIIGALLIIVSDRKQALHDVIAGTLVLRRD